jgi:CO/xanthine dehydrogenase Mo-binding subunit
MSENAQIPAIISAIHNVIGVWITEWPIGPEVVLRAPAFKET